MKKKYKILLGIVVIAVFYNACSIEKRHYRNGYNIQSFGTKKGSSTAISEPDTINYSKPAVEDACIASLNQLMIFPLSKRNSITLETTEPNCDLIILKSGDEISGKVTEINLQEIKYKKCDNLDGPVISILKEDVFMIKYANGTKDIINQIKENHAVQIDSKELADKSKSPVPRTENNKKQERLKMAWSAIPMLVLAYLDLLFSILLGAGLISPILAVIVSILGLVFTIITTILYKKHPEKYKKMRLWVFYLVFILMIFLGIGMALGY